jgi:hypothetical protein
MSQRHFLLNTTMLSSDTAALSSAVEKGEATVVEVAETNYIVPLPWFACFRQSDLRSCSVVWEKRMDIEIPCLDLQSAARNLSQSLPLFEKLTGEKEWARDYWRRALSSLLKLQLPYLTIDISEMLMVMTPEDLSNAVRAALGNDEKAIEVMRKSFFEYYDGVQPYKYDDFINNRDTTDEQRIANTKALDSGVPYRHVGFRGERWRQQLLYGGGG